MPRAQQSIAAVQDGGHQQVHEIRDIGAMPRRGDRAVDERCVHERDRSGIGEHERDHRGNGVGAASGFFGWVDGRAAAGAEHPIDDDNGDKRGDPIAHQQHAADRATRFQDVLQLVQFHPSGLIEPEDSAGTLVSEAARGEGGILRNDLGERFMKRYDPERMELSTRDRVALAAYTEIKEGRGTPRGGVWLDVSHLPRTQIMDRLPRVYQTLMDLQLLDITTTPIEIAPTAHYSMGGVWVRPEDHSTDVDGLYAIGEASSGLHGANRLGGNSLIELLVYGKIVGQAAAAYSARLNAQQRSHAAVSAARDEVDEILASNGPENVRSLQRALRNAMTEHAGVVRDEAGLLRGLRELAEIEERLTHLGVHPDIAGFYDLAHAFDLKASAIAARATLEAALERRETRGCHNRSDYPDLDEALNVNLVWSGPGRIKRETITVIPQDISGRMREVSTHGKLVE